MTSGRWLATSFSAGKVVSEAFMTKVPSIRVTAKAAFNKHPGKRLFDIRTCSRWGSCLVATSAKQLTLFVHRRFMLNFCVRQLFERFSYPFLGLRFRLLMLVLLGRKDNRGERNG